MCVISRIGVEFKRLGAGSTTELYSANNDFNILLMNGGEACPVVIQGDKEVFLLPYSIFLVSKDTSLTITVPSGGVAIAMFFDYVGRYCDDKVCNYLEKHRLKLTKSSSMLAMNDVMKAFFTTMESSFSELFVDIYFKELKYKEFFYILCNWLDVSELSRFLSPAMTMNDREFRRSVMENFENSYRVKELAAACGYSEREFVSRFKQEFGTLPNKWLTEQLNKAAVLNLSDLNLSFKDIAENLHMSSVQSLNRYCMREFGHTPGQLRSSLLKK